MTCVMYEYDRMMLLTSVVAFCVSLAVTIKTDALNPNVDTASSNYWGKSFHLDLVVSKLSLSGIPKIALL